MPKRGRVKQWSRDNKLALAGVVVGVLGLISGIVAALVTTSGSGNSTNIRTNNGQVNIGSTVYNNTPMATWGNPEPGGPTAPGQANSCSAASPAPSGSTHQKRPVQAVAVDFFARPYRNAECFNTSVAPSVTPSTIEFEIRYINTSNTIQHNVVFRVQLAKGLYLVPGTTYIMNGNYPKGYQIDTDAIAHNGIILGSYTPRAAAYVAFEVNTPAIDDLHCGRNTLRSVAYVQPKGADYFYNTADVILTRPCPSSAPS